MYGDVAQMCHIFPEFQYVFLPSPTFEGKMAWWSNNFDLSELQIGIFVMLLVLLWFELFPPLWHLRIEMNRF